MDAWLFKLLSVWIISYLHLQITSQGKNTTCRTWIDTDTMLETFCQLVGKEHMTLSCLNNEEVLITDVIQGIKRNDVCTHKVIVQSNRMFCCKIKGNDILLDANCLKYISHEEEKERYTTTLLSIISKCSQRRSCDLNATTVELIPRGIPLVDKFSAYVGVAYTCYKGQSPKATQVNFCESAVANGTNVFLRSPATYLTAPDYAFNCSCSVTSSTRVVVSALDIRLGQNQSTCGDVQLVFSNHTASKYLTCNEDSVLFGSQTVFEGDKMVSINLNQLHRLRVPKMVWLNISTVDGSQVTVLCRGPSFLSVTSEPPSSEPPQPQPPQTAQIPRIKANQEMEYGFSYWSFVFAIVGVIGACCTMGIALAIFLTCRRKLRHDEKYDKEPQYATVADYVQHGTPLRMSRNSIYSQKKCRNYSNDTYRSECDCYSMSTIDKRSQLPPSPPPKTYEMHKYVKGENSDKLTVDITVLPTNVDYIDSPNSDERLISENDDGDAEVQVPENIMVTKL